MNKEESKVDKISTQNVFYQQSRVYCHLEKMNLKWEGPKKKKKIPKNDRTNQHTTQKVLNKIYIYFFKDNSNL